MEEACDQIASRESRTGLKTGHYLFIFEAHFLINNNNNDNQQHVHRNSCWTDQNKLPLLANIQIVDTRSNKSFQNNDEPYLR